MASKFFETAKVVPYGGIADFSINLLH